MNDLIAFLRARLDEDEQAARAATDDGPWYSVNMRVCSGTTTIIKHTWPMESGHIIRHDPARVLREVDAKRRVVMIHSLDVSSSRRHNSVCERDLEDMPCETLRLLALPYADHPDYREEWKNDG